MDIINWVLGVAGGIVGSWIFLISVFFFAIIAERRESIGWTVVLSILTFMSLDFIFGVFDWMTEFSWWVLALLYSAGGIAHAIWRWFRLTSTITENYNKLASEKKDGYLSEDELLIYRVETDYRENLDRITYWILVWPVSGAAHLLGDIFITVQNIVVKFLSVVFDFITKKARSKAKFNVSQINDLDI